MSATFTLNFFRSGINFNKWGSFQLPGLLNFGEFKVSVVPCVVSVFTRVQSDVLSSVSGWRQELPPVDSGGPGLLCPDGGGGRPVGGALQLREQGLGQVPHPTHPPQGQVLQVRSFSSGPGVVRGSRQNHGARVSLCRVLESLLVTMVTTVVIFAASMLLGECRDLASPTTNSSAVSLSSGPRRLLQAT